MISLNPIDREVIILAKIRCVVEECLFNEDHICQAEEIEVRSSGTMSVINSEGTACETFIPRD